VKGALGTEVEGNKVKINGSVEYTGETKVREWGELEIGGAFGVSGVADFGPKKEGEEEAENSAEAKGGTVGEAALKGVVHRWENDHPDPILKSVDIVAEAGGEGPKKEDKAGAGSYSLGVGVKLSFEGGLEVSGKLTLVKLGSEGGSDPATGGARGEGFHLEGPELEGEVKNDVSLAEIMKGEEGASFGQDVRWDGKATFAGKATLKPDKKWLAAQVAERVAPETAARVGAAAGDVGAAVQNILASGPALVGILGAYITVKATLATLEQGDEEKRVASAALAAIEGYETGFMSGIGIEMSGGDPAWYADAKGKGASAKSAIIAKIRSDPRFAQYNFSDAELAAAIEEGIKGHRDEFLTELHARVKPQIAALYIEKWHESLGWWEKTFTNEEKSGERNIRTRMGISDLGELPKPQIGEPPSAAPAGHE
jgi:hypothetical protein